MGAKNYNDIKLTLYFNKLSNLRSEVPFITKVSKETSVSNATISRYIKKQGYYNFGEFRATRNREIHAIKKESNDRGFNKIFEYDRILIITSVSTKIIGTFLKERLEFSGIDIEIVTENTTNTWDKDTLTLLITLSSESISVNKYLDSIKGNMLFISTKAINKRTNLKQIILEEYSISARNSYDVFNSIVRIINWLNSVINIYQINNKKLHV